MFLILFITFSCFLSLFLPYFLPPFFLYLYLHSDERALARYRMYKVCQTLSLSTVYKRTKITEEALFEAQIIIKNPAACTGWFEYIFHTVPYPDQYFPKITSIFTKNINYSIQKELKFALINISMRISLHTREKKKIRYN